MHRPHGNAPTITNNRSHRDAAKHACHTVAPIIALTVKHHARQVRSGGQRVLDRLPHDNAPAIQSVGRTDIGPGPLPSGGGGGGGRAGRTDDHLPNGTRLL